MTRELADFDVETFTYAGLSHDVYRAGTGPAAVVMHELPGLHPGVIEFGSRLADGGYTIYLPSLFGRPGEEFSRPAVRRTVRRICVSREFALLADRTSPVATWLRALAARAHDECGGTGIGAIGMGFTGGFALAMAVEPAVLGSVLGQPSIPAALTKGRRRALGLDQADLEVLKQRTDDGFGALGLRFNRDRATPAERFERLRRELGEAFQSIEIDSSPGNPHGIAESAHSVLTFELKDEPGHPTRAALDHVLEFLSARLG